MAEPAWAFEAELFAWGEEPAWVFLATPADVDEEIHLMSGPPNGFGSVRVEASIGKTSWRTSVFPSKELGFVLPVKKDVRRREQVDVGDSVAVQLRLI